MSAGVAVLSRCGPLRADSQGRTPLSPLRDSTLAGRAWPRRALALAATFLGAVVLLPASSAEACTYRPVTVQPIATAVPPGGPLFIDVRCTESDYCKLETPRVELTREDETVTGRIELLRFDRSLHLSFFPDAELVAGATYQASVFTDGEGTHTFRVRVDPAVSWDAPPLAAIASRLSSGSSAYGEPLCCPGLYSCFDSCFYERARRVALVTVALEGPVPPDAEDPYPAYLYRLRYRDGDEDHLTGWMRADYGGSAGFAEPAARYCVTLERRSRIDDSVEAREFCHDADPSVRIGEPLPVNWEESGLRIEQCRIPPGADARCDPRVEPCDVPSQQLLEAWCTDLLPHCGKDAGARGHDCAVVQAYCAGTVSEDESAPPSASGDGGVHANEPHASDDEDASVGPRESDGVSASAPSCHARGSGGSLPTPPLWIVFVALLPLRRRHAARVR